MNALEEYTIIESEPINSPYNVLVRRRAHLITLFNSTYEKNGSADYRLYAQIRDIEEFINEKFPNCHK